MSYAEFIWEWELKENLLVKERYRKKAREHYRKRVQKRWKIVTFSVGKRMVRVRERLLGIDI